MIKSGETGQFAGRRPPASGGSNPKLAMPVETPFEINGREHAARLLGFSQEGGWLATTHRPSVGSLVRIGRVSARVVDHFQDGVAIQFLDIEH